LATGTGLDRNSDSAAIAFHSAQHNSHGATFIPAIVAPEPRRPTIGCQEHVQITI
jgi:hypothetical protein